MSGIDLSSYLKKTLEKRKQANTSYSLRGFARDLGISSSHLSQLINGQKVPGHKTVKKLALSLDIPIEKIQHTQIKKRLATTLFFPYKNSFNDRTKKNVQLTWQHNACLELFKVKSPNKGTKWISDKLQITNSATKTIITDLIEWDLLKPSKGEETYIVESNNYYIPNQTSEDKKNYQKSILEQSKLSIDKVDIAERDHSTITMAIQKNNLIEAKKIITKFRRELCAFLEESGDPEDVYHLNIGLFPAKDYLNDK